MARSRIALDGLPHSEISGSKPVCGSPELIAAYHVLHRRPAPRHPPYALSSLTTTFTLFEIGCDRFICPATLLLPRIYSVVNEPGRDARGSLDATDRPSFTREERSLASGGGADRDRTGGLLVANQALSQLSYSPSQR